MCDERYVTKLGLKQPRNGFMPCHHASTFQAPANKPADYPPAVPARRVHGQRPVAPVPPKDLLKIVGHASVEWPGPADARWYIARVSRLYRCEQKAGGNRQACSVTRCSCCSPMRFRTKPPSPHLTGRFSYASIVVLFTAHSRACMITNPSSASLWQVVSEECQATG